MPEVTHMLVWEGYEGPRAKIFISDQISSTSLKIDFLNFFGNFRISNRMFDTPPCRPSHVDLKTMIEYYC